jgi:hypothetical protein
VITSSHTTAEQEAVSALVRAIRRVMRSPAEGDNLNGGVTMFRVEDVFTFARRLVEQGVTVSGDGST